MLRYIPRYRRGEGRTQTLLAGSKERIEDRGSKRWAAMIYQRTGYTEGLMRWKMVA